MTTKIVYLANKVQEKIFNEVLLPELTAGALRGPVADATATAWVSVEVKVSAKLVGTFGFQSPKKYNFASGSAFAAIDKKMRVMSSDLNINMTNLKGELKHISRILASSVINDKVPILRVGTELQKALLEKLLIPQMKTGFWKDFRPANNHEAWKHVRIEVADTDLGAFGWLVPRNYDFVNPSFMKENEKAIMAIAHKQDSKLTLKLVKRELQALSRIVGGRLKSVDGKVIKLNRGGKTVSTTKKITLNTVKRVPVVFA